MEKDYEEEFDRGEVEIDYTKEDVSRMENDIKNWESQIEEIDNDPDCDDDETMQSYKEELENKIEGLRQELYGSGDKESDYDSYDDEDEED